MQRSWDKDEWMIANHEDASEGEREVGEARHALRATGIGAGHSLSPSSSCPIGGID